ncbi:hypothetical protein BCR42DRAFT_381062 [Absidia repens]|uniref:Uncharacterized protein n=1 Tax=Absidia repens TaxID=90262 RepID=A0A1X2I611_9FUNG|nr:hypothetical protein BCR42DRAFT_381062 [Absidia repens]
MTSHTTPLPLKLDNKLPHDALQHAPPSPTFSTTSLISSMSWIADKGPQDLIPLLKNAYTAIKEKEKDLTLAAEIGKQLLSTNVELEQNYRQLLQRQQQQPLSATDENESTDDDECPDMQYIPSMNARQVIIEVLEQKNVELNERLESLSTEHTTMKNTSGKRTKQLEAEMTALKNDLEMATNKIQELELLNKKQQENQLRNRNGKNNSNNENEATSIDGLLNDVQRLETEHQQALEAKRTMESKLAAALTDLHQLKQQFDNFEFTESGYKTLQQTYDRQFQHITQLNQSLEDHRAVFQKLRDRGINIHSLSSTPCPSVIMKQNDNTSDHHHPHHSLLDELESEWNKRNNHGTATTPAPSQQQDPSFPLGSQPKPTATSSSSSSTSSSSLLFSQYFGDMDPFESLLTKATGIDNGLIDDALNLINQLEQGIEQQGNNQTTNKVPASISAVGDDAFMTTWTTIASHMGGVDSSSSIINNNNDHDHDLHLALVEYTFPSQDLYPDLPSSSSGTLTRYDPSMTRPGLVRQWISKAFQRLWRWFRFAFVLSTAVMISLWSGPDEMLLAIDN